MKKIIKKSLVLMTVALLCAVMVMASCELNSETKGDIEYKVTVKDALGTPYSMGVVVQFMKDGAAAGMQACNENGEAAVTLPADEYGVNIVFTDTSVDYYYNKELKVTADAPAAEVIMANKITAEPKTVVVQDKEFDAYALSVGCTYAEVSAGERNYYLFTPTEAGNYRISVVDGNCSIGYYGAPHFIQENNIANVVGEEEKYFESSITASMVKTDGSGTTVLVIGVDPAEGVTNCVIGIQRLGDPIKTIEDEPWTIYKKTAELAEYTLPAGAEIKEFDLTASTDTYKLVYNEADGFYHLDNADGPLVLVRLGEDCEYIACFQTMLDRSGVVKYFYNEDGSFVKRESYSECLLEYIEYIDEDEGVYPLTEDLKYIIQQRGEYAGWWNAESNTYIFKDDNNINISNINADIAWLLMCCYIEG